MRALALARKPAAWVLLAVGVAALYLGHAVVSFFCVVGWLLLIGEARTYSREA